MTELTTENKNKRIMYSSDVLLPITTEPIKNGSVVVENGRILDYGRRDQILLKWKGIQEISFKGVLMPGLVNAHTHLQYTSFIKVGQGQYKSYEDWCEAFGEVWREKDGTEDWFKVSKDGIILSLKAGVTTLADISTSYEVVEVLPECRMQGISFIEVMGPTWKQWETCEREKFLKVLEDKFKFNCDGFSVAISPHAPYSLDTKVMKDLVRIADKYGVKLHTHLGESKYENEYTSKGVGPLADMVKSTWPGYEIIDKKGCGLSTTAFVQSTGQFNGNSHVAHGIYVGENDRKILRDTGTYVALCPRSNLVIGLDAPPIAAYLKENNPIAVGTDSLSSCPSLDLLEDVRCLKRLAKEQGYTSSDLDRRLVEVATINGARCLGLGCEAGSVEIGKRANFALFDLDSTTESVYRDIVDNGAGNCSVTIVNGEIRFDRKNGIMIAD